MKDTGDDAMQALDSRLRKMFSGLDAAPGFDARLQARLAELAAQPEAALRARLEREYAAARAAALRTARLEGATIGVAGLGALLMVWRLGPDLAQLYSASVQAAGPVTAGFVVLAASGAALWAILRRFGVDLRRLIRP